MLFRNDIQGLRALAFILVFFFHLNASWLPGGFIGVDMFFVISGFLISSIMLNQKEKGTFSFPKFYEKRLKRIVPAHFFMLLIVAIAGYFVYLAKDADTLKDSLVKSALFLSNRYFAGGESYFGAKFAENPLLHTWSLSIEMQFYFVLPLIVIFVRNKILPYLLIAGLLLITGYTSYKLYADGVSPATYFSLFSRMPEFFVGTLLAIFASKRKFSETTSFLMSFFGLIILVVSLVFINENSPFPGALALLPAAGTGLLLISGTNAISRFFSLRPLVYVGELSYSLYLWHWPVMALMRYRNGWAVPTPFSFSEVVVVVVFTIVLSLLSFYLVEEKFRHFDNRRFAVSFAPMACLIAFCVFGGAKMKEAEKVPKRFGRSAFGQPSHNTGKAERLGDPKAKDKIFLFGDSHSLILKYVLHKIGLENGFSFSALSCSSFPALKGVSKSEIPPNLVANFLNAQKLVDATNSYIEKNDIIILTSLDFTRARSLKSAVINLIEKLKPHQKLILIQTYKVLDRDPFKANAGFVKTSSADFHFISQAANHAFLTKIDQRYDNVYLFDLSNSNIFEEAPYHQDSVMYYDDNHLNLFGSDLLYEDIGDEFANFLSNTVHFKPTTPRFTTINH